MPDDVRDLVSIPCCRCTLVVARFGVKDRRKKGPQGSLFLSEVEAESQFDLAGITSREG